MNPDELQPLTRLVVPKLDNILGHPFEVLDDGFIRVVDYMGSDSSIVQAARVSYGTGTKRIHEDEGLIRYLLRNRHTTPFEMCEIKLHVRAPMDCWRQWIRHRTASVNEYSTRYSVAIDSMQATRAQDWRLQTTANRQGSGDSLEHHLGEQLSKRESTFHELAREIYEERLAQRIAREQARKDLPLSTYTEAYWKIDLHNLLHFLALRMNLHAQKEIREFAQIIGNEVVSRWCPITWAAFRDYRLESISVSSREIKVINAINAGDYSLAGSIGQDFGWIGPNGELEPNRERAEAEEKLRALGIQIPWQPK